MPIRSTGMAPFHLLFGTRMRLKENPQIREILETENAILFQDKRNQLRDEARNAISTIQTENRRNFNKKRKFPQETEFGI